MSGLTVLLLGGYGTFGTRIVRLLRGEEDLHLIVAGRSLARAKACVAEIGGKARLSALELDRNEITPARLHEIRPDLLIDASGPFQIYGDAYRVPAACMEVGIDYADLADASGFVTGIAQLDEPARAAGRFALSGLSTCPALTGAAIAALTEGWQRIETIEGGIAPSPFATMGRNVVDAILGYAGKPVPIRRGGRDRGASALIDARHRTVAPPGVLPLGRRRFTLVDVPDLVLDRARFNALRDQWFGAATQPAILHRLLSIAAWLVRLRLLKSLSWLAGPAHAVMRRVRWGEHRGGMFVGASGVDAGGRKRRRSWHLIAEGDDGPFVPALGTAILVRQMLRGHRPEAGARSAARVFALSDFEDAFGGLAIRAGIREDEDEAALYPRLLQGAWSELPEAIRAMHAAPQGLTARGTARVDRGGNPLARFAGWLNGFPSAGTDIPVTVRFSVRDGIERWERNFAGKRFVSFQRAGTGALTHLLAERFGPLTFGLALVVEGGRLRLIARGWRAFGIPMPRWLLPTGEAFEHVVEGRFAFHVEIAHPLTGLIVRYRGTLSPVDPE